MRIGLFAGEASGDILGADLIAQIKQHHPEAEFFGVGGKHMIEQGLDSLYPIEDFAVMGIWEPLIKLPSLLRARRDLAFFLREAAIDIFIGIDSPDFTLGLEKKMKRAGIKTVHYVSPSVWAWRAKRVKKIEKCADAVLCLLPFELEYYKDSQTAAYFVGHIAARKAQATQRQIDKCDKIGLAVLPGSRAQEIKNYSPLFAEVIEKLLQRHAEVEPTISFASSSEHKILSGDLATIAEVEDTELLLSRTQIALVSSGTAVLEAFLAGNKVVAVASSKSRIVTWLVRRLVLPNTKYLSLPNILLKAPVVRECIIEQATADNIVCQLEEALVDTTCHEKDRQKIISMLTAEKSVADIILELLCCKQG